MMRLFRVFFILFLLCTWSFAGGNMRVTGTGSTPQDARTAAYKNGLWQYSKGFLDSDVIKKRRGDILSILLRTPSVFIGSEELLSEKNEYGLYTVQMNLTVKEEPLVSAFRDAGMLSTGKIQKPSVMILVDEYAQGEESMDNTVTYLLEERLTKQGYRVLEQKQLEKNAEDNTDLARFAFSSGADIIVRGRVTTGKTRVKEIYGVEQVSVPVKINVRALRADNAEIITSVSKNIMKRTMDEFSAREEGLREGGTIVADHLDKAVAAYWKHSISGLKHIELQAESKNSAALKGIGEAFSGLASVKGLSIRYLEDQRALYDMRVMGTMQNLRRDLEKSGQWKVVAVAPGKIALESAATAGEMQYGIPAPDLSIVSANVADIFPSRMKYYEDNPLSEIVLELNTGALEDLTVSVMIPRIMDAPSQKRVNLTAGQEDTVKMNLLLNEKALLDITSEKKVPAKISLTYYRQGREFTRNLAVPVKVYSVNGMNWNETAGIGAFVTYQNTLVDRLARQAVSSYEKGPLEDQFEDAVSIFGALRQYGITYVKDPVNVAGSGLDKIQYPVETLEKKSGDCDDSSVLYASLLSAVGIPAAFIVYDDHVLVMFDTGIYSKNADRLGYDKKNLVIHKDRCWIPVETTLLTKSFFEAWTAAAEEFQQALADKEDIDIVEC
ncbi:MAG: transglutaminase-like domain-containing protein, partial [Fibrobacterota bacterium]